MNMEPWWNDTAKRKEKCSEKNTAIATFLPQSVLGLNLRTKIKLSYNSRLSSYHAVNTFLVGYKKDVKLRCVRATIFAVEK
jgi:hypothetical protein